MNGRHRANILFAFAVALCVALAYKLREPLMVIYVSALFAVVLLPAVEAIERLKIGKWSPGRGVALLLLIVVLLGAIVLFFAVAIPPIVRDARELIQAWPTYAARMTERLHRLPFGENFDPAMLQQYASGAIGGAVGVAAGLAGGILGFFSWLILTIYFMLDGHRAFEWAMSLVPPGPRPRLRETMLRAEKRVRNWLVGQLAMMVILGISAGITFAILDVRYYTALAVIAGALNVIPIVGPLIAFVLAGVVALTDGFAKFAAVGIFFLAYQQLETAVLTPRIMKASVDLPALAVIISLSIGGALAGILGALVAVPTAALASVLIDEYLVYKDYDAIEETHG